MSSRVTGSVHVLVYGSIDRGVCDLYRFGVYREALARLGVELRAWDRYSVVVPAGYEDRPEVAVANGLAELDRSQLDWADVLVFRRWYQTCWACSECDTVGRHAAEIGGHARRTGHAPAEPEWLLRPLFESVLERPEVLRGRAVLYETDDDLLTPNEGHGLERRIAAERDP